MISIHNPCSNSRNTVLPMFLYIFIYVLLGLCSSAVCLVHVQGGKGSTGVIGDPGSLGPAVCTFVDHIDFPIFLSHIFIASLS